MFKLSKKKQILSGKMVFGSKFSQKRLKIAQNGDKNGGKSAEIT